MPSVTRPGAPSLFPAFDLSPNPFDLASHPFDIANLPSTNQQVNHRLHNIKYGATITKPIHTT